MKITLIGCGAWAMAIASHLARKEHEVTVWAHSKEEAERLLSSRALPNVFPEIVFPDSISYTNDREEAVKGAELIVFAVASPYTRATAAQFAPFIKPGARIVTVTKGIEEGSLMTQADILIHELPGAVIGALSGPTHAEEVVRGLPTAIVSASEDRAMAELVQDAFMSETFRVYTSPDVLGVELGGSLKNVIALAAGMCDGVGYGDNCKAALITRGIHEIALLAIRMGAREETLQGLSGIGDLIVTCASQHSRNRKAGVLMGQGLSMDEAMKEVGQIVEGVYSAKAALALAEQYEVPLPIVEEVNHILFDGKNVRQAVLSLFARDRKMETRFKEEDLPECWRSGNSR